MARHPGEAGFDPTNVKQLGLGHFFRETLFFAYGEKYSDPATMKGTLASAGGDGSPAVCV